MRVRDVFGNTVSATSTIARQSVIRMCDCFFVFFFLFFFLFVLCTIFKFYNPVVYDFFRILLQ